MQRLFILSLCFSFGLLACNSQNKVNSGGHESEQSAESTFVFKDIDVSEFKAKMNDSAVVILDVRTPKETAKGMIEGAVNIDFEASGFAAELEQLDPEKTYLVYCRSGARSGKACQMMKEKGFREFYNLDGGYLAWSKQQNE